MRGALGVVVAVVAIGACGGQTFTVGGDGGSSSSSGGSSGGASSSGSSSGGSSSSSGGSSSGGSSSSSGASSSSSGSSSGGSSSGPDGGRVPLNHRTDDSACSQPAAPGDCSIGEGDGECAADNACTAGTDGRCVQNNGGAIFCTCTYDTCTHDADCAAGQTCACHGSTYTYGDGNTCIAGNCRVDADCGAGNYCSPADNVNSCGSLLGYFCHTPQDTCIDDSDCTNSSSGPQVCTYSSTAGHWQCKVQGLCG